MAKWIVQCEQSAPVVGHRVSTGDSKQTCVISRIIDVPLAAGDAACAIRIQLANGPYWKYVAHGIQIEPTQRKSKRPIERSSIEGAGILFLEDAGGCCRRIELRNCAVTVGGEDKVEGRIHSASNDGRTPAIGTDGVGAGESLVGGEDDRVVGIQNAAGNMALSIGLKGPCSHKRAIGRRSLKRKGILAVETGIRKRHG